MYTTRRLAFNLFFYGTQLALFAIGWYLQVPSLPPSLTLFPGNQPEASLPQCPQMVPLDLQGRWPHPRL